MLSSFKQDYQNIFKKKVEKEKEIKSNRSLPRDENILDSER